MLTVDTPNSIRQRDYGNLFLRIMALPRERAALFLNIAELGVYWKTKSCPHNLS